MNGTLGLSCLVITAYPMHMPTINYAELVETENFNLLSESNNTNSYCIKLGLFCDLIDYHV